MDKLQLVGIYKLIKMVTRVPMKGDHKLYECDFRINVNDHMELDFVDAATNEVVRESTAVVDHTEAAGGVHVLTTKSGTVYVIQQLTDRGEDITIDLGEAEPVLDDFDCGEEDDVIWCQAEAERPDPEPMEEEEEPEQIPAEEPKSPIPPKPVVPVFKEPEVEVPLPDVEVTETNVFRHINYGDGFDGTVYHFAAPISYDEFLAFLKSKGAKINKLDNYAWYEDHDLITTAPIKTEQRISPVDHKPAKRGDKSTVWTHLHVRVYTD